MASSSAAPAAVRARPEVSSAGPPGRGRIVRIGARRGLGDLYHGVLTMRWSVFLALVVASQLLMNTLFALAFWLQPDDVGNAHGFVDLFYFSVQTWATIGYGGMTPKTTYGNILV